ncbi:hypothetical protein OEZ86_005197 [Tetradesmus obliquus]|nr:hypothetical protein OEZ86_005197 [Tetradesmus obliquus]
MFCRVGSGASSIFRAGRNQQRKAQQPAAKPKARPDVVKSKQDLLQELNRQAELNTLVLQREQAALRALQESQGYGLPAQASVNAHLGSYGFGASQDVMGPPAGLQPLAVKAAKNHRFYDASPKAFSAAQLSPFADADWRFDWGGPGSPAAAYAAQQQSLLNQTFPDSPQFRTGRVFEIPADAGMDMPAAAAAAAAAAAGSMHGAGMVGQQQQVHHGSPAQLAAMAAQAAGYGNGLPQGPLPLAQLQLLQQQQQVQDCGWLGMHSGVEGTTGSPAYTIQLMQQQMQPQQLLQSCHTLADVSDALQAAQGFADPAVRMHLIKELKQKQYKLELEQQIAEREATRQAAKAAAAAREAAEDAARAAAPPPWDPAARASRWVRC